MMNNSGLWFFRHVPNLLSASRIPAALLLLATYRADSPARAAVSLILFALIAVTDLIDGHLARRYGVASEFGYLLDGLGDRAVHVAAYLLLLTAGVLPLLLVWALLFREVCQYGVRLAEPAWHAAISRTDRLITKAYAGLVHAALGVELLRSLLAAGPPPPTYAAAIQLLLGAAAIASYSRIVPRLAQAWSRATHG